MYEFEFFRVRCKPAKESLESCTNYMYMHLSPINIHWTFFITNVRIFIIIIRLGFCFLYIPFSFRSPLLFSSSRTSSWQRTDQLMRNGIDLCTERGELFIRMLSTLFLVSSLIPPMHELTGARSKAPKFHQLPHKSKGLIKPQMGTYPTSKSQFPPFLWWVIFLHKTPHIFGAKYSMKTQQREEAQQKITHEFRSWMHIWQLYSARFRV
jgi:hypothetical protein